MTPAEIIDSIRKKRDKLLTPAVIRQVDDLTYNFQMRLENISEVLNWLEHDCPWDFNILGKTDLELKFYDKKASVMFKMKFM